jgi:uncharacterized peroxidase-related enzyme
LQREEPEGNHDGFVAQLAEDHRAVPLDPADLALLDYALKLTVDPGGMDESDVERLRHQGFDDVAIHDLATVTAYFAFVNRIADGLGVELEDRWDETGVGGSS